MGKQSEIRWLRSGRTFGGDFAAHLVVYHYEWYTGGVINTVIVTRNAEKDLRKVPARIAEALRYWVAGVERSGLEEMRKLKGYHDEPLKGRLHGKRSIRLSLAYRAIYEVKNNGTIEFVAIEEVNKHEY